MPVPKRRKSQSKIRMRRSHDAMTAPNTTKCSKCGEPLEPHRVCPACGFYKGKKVLEVQL